MRLRSVADFFAIYFPSIALALARIFAADEADSFPRLTICVARAFAFCAWDLSGIGYLRAPGIPNLDAGRALRLAACSFISTPCGVTFRRTLDSDYRLLRFLDRYSERSESICSM